MSWYPVLAVCLLVWKFSFVELFLWKEYSHLREICTWIILKTKREIINNNKYISSLGFFFSLFLQGLKVFEITMLKIPNTQLNHRLSNRDQKVSLQTSQKFASILSMRERRSYIIHAEILFLNSFHLLCHDMSNEHLINFSKQSLFLYFQKADRLLEAFFSEHVGNLLDP